MTKPNKTNSNDFYVSKYTLADNAETLKMLISDIDARFKTLNSIIAVTDNFWIDDSAELIRANNKVDLQDTDEIIAALNARSLELQQIIGNYQYVENEAKSASDELPDSVME